MTPNSEDLIKTLLRDSSSLLDMEEIVLDAVRDLLKDEIKKRIKKKLDEDPALRDELKSALETYVEAKIRETYALLKIGKCGAKLSLEMLPKNLQAEIGKEIASMLESEFSRLFGTMDEER